MSFPRIWVPLLLFFLWTVLADSLCPDPWGGRAQIRKFFVFLLLPLMYGVFREQFQKVYYVMMAWTVAATASGVWGLVQFVQKYEHAKHTGANFYLTYLARRITGFESHWMTYGALELSVLSLLLAQLFFSNRKMPRWVYGSIVVLLLAILLGWTRSIWLATIPASLYLLWFWRPKMVALVPLVLLLAFLVSPPATRSRIESIFAPHGDTDSNRFRYVTFWTGVEMTKAHPWFGIGPEQIRRQFDSYVPPFVQRPAALRLLRTSAQYLYAVRGGTRISRAAFSLMADRPGSVGLYRWHSPAARHSLAAAIYSAWRDCRDYRSAGRRDL